MGFFADFKAKRALKAATKQHNSLLEIWQEDLACLRKIIEAITAASEGKDSVPNTLMQKAGEHTLWSATGIFHETGRTASQYVGGSTGVSVPIGGGIRFRVGAMKGQVVPGIELQVDKDQGVVMLTTERLIFSGPMHSREWNFDKLLHLSTTDDDSDYFISVSNRQKSSGVRFDPATGREFNRFLGSATSAHEHGIPEVLTELKKLETEALKLKPVLTIASERVALQ